MGFTNEHHYMTVIGDAYNAAEKWQFGLRLTPTGGVSNETVALDVAPVVEAWWTGAAPWSAANSLYPFSSHRLTELKVATIGVDGLYPADEESYSHFYLPPIAGTIAPWAGTVPQSTIAVTLLTAKPRGLGSKGRIYLPPVQDMSVGADGLMTAGSAQDMANNINLLIQQINAVGTVGNVAVMSRGKGVGTYDATKKKIIYTYPNAGVTELVVGTSCGRAVDTQRRRRRQLAEQYVNDQN